MTTEKKRLEAQQQVLKDMHSAIMAQTTANEAKTKLIDSLLQLQVVISSKEPGEPTLKPNDIAPRAVLWSFAQVMEKKLRENDHKSGWSKMSYNELLVRLRQETDELARAIGSGSDSAVVSEAADVANFAMFIADNALNGRTR